MYGNKSTEVKRRRRRERIGVMVVLALVVLFGFLEGWFFQFRSDLPPLGNLLLFALINLNVLLLLLLTYLVLRNIVKLLFQRKKNLLGSQLKTRLVIAFIGLTLIPTIPLFGLATQFISFSLDYWFSHQVEDSLEQSVALGKNLLEAEESKLKADTTELQGDVIHWQESDAARQKAQTERFRRELLAKYRLDALFQYAEGKGVQWQVWGVDHKPYKLQGMRELISGYTNGRGPSGIISLGGDRQAAVTLFPMGGETGEAQKGVPYLFAMRLLPKGVTQRLQAVAEGYENYLQLKLLQRPFKISHFIIFSIVTLLVIFGAVWFGFFLARSITVPIEELLDGTQRVADGDLDIHLDWDQDDEMGRLVSSFNKMVHDLRDSRGQLAGAYSALQQSHQELEQRRRYMEIVLTNIGTGVVSVDTNGVVMTINAPAERMFGVVGREIIGRSYSELLLPHQLDIVRSFKDMYQMSPKASLEQRVQVIVGSQPLTLLIKVSVLSDDQDRHLGVVVVFDDLTELEKANRMAAWREVARRIAHEIKNPLTPIQLSAQRLRRKYSELVEEPEGIFDECTQMIVDQVRQMKRLVNEFSNFARLPQANPAPCQLLELVEETLSIYRHTYPAVDFSVVKATEAFPVLKVDQNQFRQVMINLLDNAVHAFDGGEQKVEVRLFYDDILKIARLEFADSGRGLSELDKLRIFEPYYSTKEKGTGLGLAIVASIVADHHGFVRVRDNNPRGTVIIIELPGQGRTIAV